MEYLTPAAFARKHGVTRQRVYQWIKAKRLPVYNYCPGRVLLDAKTPAPAKRKPGRIFISLDNEK